MELNEILAIYRKRAKLKQIEVGEKLGITGGAYAAIEQGRTPLSVDRLFDFINVFGEEFATVILLYFQNKILKITLNQEKLNMTNDLEKEIKKDNLDIHKFATTAKQSEIEFINRLIES